MIDNMNIEKLKSAIQRNRIYWKKHAIQRLAERSIKQKSIVDVILKGICIEEYSEDYPFPSGLFMSREEGKLIHTVASYDEFNDFVYIITAYEPSLEFFESDYITRKGK